MVRVSTPKDKPVHAIVTYNNTGRQPAQLSINVNMIYTYDDWTISGRGAKEIKEAHDTCFRVRHDHNDDHYISGR